MAYKFLMVAIEMTRLLRAGSSRNTFKGQPKLRNFFSGNGFKMAMTSQPQPSA